MVFPTRQMIFDVIGDLITNVRHRKQLVLDERIIGPLDKFPILGRLILQIVKPIMNAEPIAENNSGFRRTELRRNQEYECDAEAIDRLPTHAEGDNWRKNWLHRLYPLFACKLDLCRPKAEQRISVTTARSCQALALP